MNEIKENIKDNKGLIIILILLLVVLTFISVYKKIQGNKLYDGNNLENIEPPTLELTKKNSNEYQIITKEYNEIVKEYYKDYINLLADNPEEAYNRLTDDEKEEHFRNNYELFLKTRNFLNNVNIKDNTILGVNVKEEGNKRRIKILDSSSKMYIFEEDGIWNYKVIIVGDSTEKVETTTTTSN